VFSTTAIATIYSNGPGSAALNITASPGAYTGSTSEITFITYTLPANLMGVNGQFVYNFLGSHNNTAGSKIYRQRWNGAAASWAALTSTTTVSARGQISVMNRNSASLQVAGGSNAIGGASSSANTYATINTAADVAVTLTGQLNTATDYMIFEGYTMELMR
jgi:hypothetical protein